MVEREVALSRMRLLSYVAKEYGYDTVEDMLIATGFDSVVPAVCTKCGYITDMEPDQSQGWCEECERNTVISILVLGGVI